MASSTDLNVFGTLHEITECSICLKTFTDPRMLPCVHTFCFTCLEKMGGKLEENQSISLSCPICRNPFLLENLPKNFFMNRLIQMKKTLKHEGVNPGTNKPTVNSDSAIQNEVKKNVGAGETPFEDSEEEVECDTMTGYRLGQKCEKHSRILDVYCHDCEVLVCYECLVDSHRAHRGDKVTDVANEFRREIENNIEKVSSCKFLCQALKQHSEKQRLEMAEEFSEKEQEIIKRNADLKALFDQHAQALRNDLLSMRKERLKEAEIAKEEIERYYTMLGTFEIYCHELVTQGSSNDVCRAKNLLRQRTKELEDMLNKTSISRSTVSVKKTDFEASIRDKNLIGQLEDERNEVEVFTKTVFVVGMTCDKSPVPEGCRIELSSATEVGFLSQELPVEGQRQVSAAVSSNILFVVGFGEKHDEIWRFHLVSGWSKCGRLVHGRGRHCTAFQDDSLYICGGYDDVEGKLLDSIESFDTITSKCSVVGHLASGVQNACCISDKNLLYIFCGLNESGVTEEYVQIYNTTDNICTRLTKPIPNPYNRTKAWRALRCDDLVLLLGRWTCFLFHLETKSWIEMKLLRTEVDHFGAVLENGHIFIFGGGVDDVDADGRWTWTHHDDVKSISVSDLKKNSAHPRWKDVAKLPKPALIHAWTVLDLPKVTAVQ